MKRNPCVRNGDFIDGYNKERPHQALNMQCPAECHQPSSRPYRGLPDIDYPLHDRAATVTTCGRVCFNNQKINLSQVFAERREAVRSWGRGKAGYACRESPAMKQKGSPV